MTQSGSPRSPELSLGLSFVVNCARHLELAWYGLVTQHVVDTDQLAGQSFAESFETHE
jgi:hypothetical protein